MYLNRSLLILFVSLLDKFAVPGLWWGRWSWSPAGGLYLQDCCTRKPAIFAGYLLTFFVFFSQRLIVVFAVIIFLPSFEHQFVMGRDRVPRNQSPRPPSFGPQSLNLPGPGPTWPRPRKRCRGLPPNEGTRMARWSLNRSKCRRGHWRWLKNPLHRKGFWKNLGEIKLRYIIVGFCFPTGPWTGLEIQDYS